MAPRTRTGTRTTKVRAASLGESDETRTGWCCQAVLRCVRAAVERVLLGLETMPREATLRRLDELGVIAQLG